MVEFIGVIWDFIDKLLKMPIVPGVTWGAVILLGFIILVICVVIWSVS